MGFRRICDDAQELEAMKGGSNKVELGHLEKRQRRFVIIETRWVLNESVELHRRYKEYPPRVRFASQNGHPLNLRSEFSIYDRFG